MKEFKDCKVVQDLLPNYIEKLTNEETSKYIEAHLKECNECKAMFDNMKKEIKLNINKRDEREVKYIKKFSNKMKRLKFILLAIIMVFLIIIGRKAIILKTMQDNVMKYKDQTNFQITITEYRGKSITISDIYHKDGKFLGKVQVASINAQEDSKIISYYNGEKYNTYISNGSEKVATLNQEFGINVSDRVINFIEMDWRTFIKNLFTTHITSIKCNDKECYKIEGVISTQYSYDSIYIEKDTGLPVRIESGIAYTNDNEKVSSIADYFYEFNKVTDNDLKEPDISEYKIQQ